MQKKYLLFLFAIISFSAFSQSRPGFIYNYSTEYNYTTGPHVRPYLGGKVLAQNTVADTLYINGVSKRYRQWITIVDSSLTSIDTTIQLINDTSAKYVFSYNQCYVQGDTSYFIFDCFKRNTSQIPGVSGYLPVNLLFFKMDKDYNFTSGKYLFKKDTLGVLNSSNYVTMKYDKQRNSFELFLLEFDTTSLHIDPILIRLNRQGELLYFKKWDYSVHTQSQMFINDFHYLDNGRYLLTLNVTNDIYVIADTANNQIDTSYYKPEIRSLNAIVERKNSLVLFGTSDGHKILSFKKGKLQYTLLELDKNTLQERNRYDFKVKDTLKYEVEPIFHTKKIVPLADGGYLFTSLESYYYNSRSNYFAVSSIYRVDSMANLVWSYKMADTLYNEIMGGVSVQEIPGNPNEVLWHCAVYASQTNNIPPSTWLMKFNIDGSDLGIGLTEEKLMPEFSLYPNPASDVAFVLLPFVPSGESTIDMYDLKGQLVQTQTFTVRDNLLKVSLNVPAGSYLLKVISGRYEATKQLVVE